jgi:hypothetical protein
MAVSSGRFLAECPNAFSFLIFSFLLPPPTPLGQPEDLIGIFRWGDGSCRWRQIGKSFISGAPVNVQNTLKLRPFSYANINNRLMSGTYL